MLYDGKPQSGTSYFFGVTFVYAVKPFKDPGLFFLRDSDSRIFYAETHLPAVLPQRDQHPSPLSVILYGIIAEIINHFHQDLPDSVDLYRCGLRRDGNVSATRFRRQSKNDFVDQL